MARKNKSKLIEEALRKREEAESAPAGTLRPVSGMLPS